MHVRWVAYIQRFHFTLKHKSGVTNKVANALSRRASLLTTLHTKVVGFDCFKELYENNENFGDIWGKCQQTHTLVNSMYIQDGFLFRDNQLCISKGSLREQIIRELHGGGLGGHIVDIAFCTLTTQASFPNDAQIPRPKVGLGPN